jgi:hypothetical protein
VSKANVGDRVGAISHRDGNTLYVFGFGVYDGDFVPENAGGIGKTLQQVGATNPKITLDSGKVVWGCECWWGPEDLVTQRLQGYTLVETDIDEARAKYSNGMTADIPEDSEYVQVIQAIEGEYPELDGIKDLFKSILNPYVGQTARMVFLDVSDELLGSLHYLRERGIIASATLFSVELDDAGLDANIGLLLPNGKAMSLNLTLKDKVAENTTTETI